MIVATFEPQVGVSPGKDDPVHCGSCALAGRDAVARDWAVRCRPLASACVPDGSIIGGAASPLTHVRDMQVI